MKYIIGLVAILLPMLCGAQSPPIKPLTIGDMVPDITINNIINYKATSAKLSDFKGKLIILDFWSSWCGSCIALFPHLDSLQKEFGGNLQVVLVNTKSKMTHDDEPKIKKTLERVRTRTGVSLNMPVVYNSEKLDEFFPCITIPHEVWINKDREVIGITSADEVNAENIKSILSGRDVKMKLKNDRFGVDFESPLFINGNGGNGSETIYRSIVTNYLDGIAGRSGIWHKNKTTGLYLINQSLSAITEMIYANEIANHFKMAYGNRIIMDVKDKRKFDTKSSDSFYYQNLFSYELIVPPTNDSTIFKYARQDLKRYFNISVKYELRSMECLVLTAPDGIDSTKKNAKKEAKGLDVEKASLKKYIHNYPPQFIIGLLNNYTRIPLIDETNITGNISVDLPFHLNDLTGLKESFRQAGFSLKEENRMLEVIVITDK